MRVDEFDMEANQSLNSARLKALQLDRLAVSLRHAYQGNPVYKSAFDRAKVTLNDLQCLADIGKFPFTTKKEFRDTYPFGLFAVPEKQIARIHASSGTTGKPTIVGYTKQDLKTWAGLVARSIRAAGGAPGMKVHIAYGYGLFTGGLGAHYGAEELGCTVIPVSGGQTGRQIQLICDLKPDIIMVTPSYMLALLDGFRAKGIDPRTTSLKIGIFGAEPWTDGVRLEIERAFDLKAVDIYGLSEVMGPGVAQEYASTQDGLTIWEDHFYPEIIDPNTSEVLPDGEFGELVITSLTKQALPIIRYRTRDLTRLLPGTNGPMRRIDRIGARSDDMLIIRGVNVFPSQIENEILKCTELAPHYTIEVRREGALDKVALQVETRVLCDPTTTQVYAKNLASLIKSFIGISVTIAILPPQTLQRSEGKAVRVTDLRNKTTD